MPARSRPSSARWAASARHRCPRATARSATPRWQPARATILIRLRTQLVKQRAALTNPIKAPAAKKHLGALRDAACQQIGAIEADIRELIIQPPPKLPPSSRRSPPPHRRHGFDA
jgi:hypothetical protein